MKNCSGCGDSFESPNFYADKRASDGLHSACKQCMRRRSNKWKAADPVRAAASRCSAYAAAKARDVNYVRKLNLSRYGLTIADFEAMLAAQGGRCKTCRTDKPGGRYNRLHVDHDHKTGKVRGLLCTRCNCALGMLLDSSAIANSLANYIAPRTFAAGTSEGLL